MSDWIVLSGRYSRPASPARSPTPRTAGQRRATTPWCAPPRSPAKSSTAYARRMSSPSRSGSTSTSSTPAGARRSCGSAGPDRTRRCWSTAVGCRWKSTPIAASIRLQHCAIRVSTRVWWWWGRARCAPGWNARPPGYPSISPATSVVVTPSRPSWPPPMWRWRRGRMRRSGWPHWRHWPAAPRPSCPGPRRSPRSSPPTAAPPRTTTRARSPAPSRRSSADPNYCGAAAPAGAPNISPGPGRPPACSTRWRGIALGPQSGIPTARGPVIYDPEMIRRIAVFPAVLAFAVTGVVAAGVADAEPTPPCSFTLSPPQVVQVSGASFVTATVAPAACEAPSNPHQSVACLKLQGSDSPGQCMDNMGLDRTGVLHVPARRDLRLDRQRLRDDRKPAPVDLPVGRPLHGDVVGIRPGGFSAQPPIPRIRSRSGR